MVRHSCKSAPHRALPHFSAICVALRNTRVYGFFRSYWGIKVKYPNVAKSSCLLSVASIALAGCASTPEPVIGAASTQTISSLGQDDYAVTASRTYLLRPSDRISVSVFREPEFSLEAVQIGVEGNVSVPLLGSIPAAGMTAKAFEEDMETRLGQVGLKSPMVSINIVEYASHLVTVDGSVNTPGVYQFQPGSRLSAAVAMARGPSRTAKREQIAVFREGPEGLLVAKFDYNMISEGTMLDPILEPGDRVVLGTDGLSVFWQDFLRSLPVFAVFNNAI